jgi:signal transduction histidine kinase
VSFVERFLPGSMVGRMIAVLTLSFAALLAVLSVAEQADGGDVLSAAASTDTFDRIQRMSRLLARIRSNELATYVDVDSLCHAGHEVTGAPWPGMRETPETMAIARKLARKLGLVAGQVRVGYAMLAREDFGYRKCRPGEMAFPVDGLVIGMRLPGGAWFHTEIHPHEAHFQRTFADWFQRSALAFVLIAVVAALSMYRLGRPLRRLTAGALRFGSGLKVEPLAETGPSDLRRTISAFNAMQRQVIGEIDRRTSTLAALSHDLRTPLTELRVKAELVEDDKSRSDLIASIVKMETVANSAIEFLKGEARTEPMRLIDLTALIESECADFQEIGAPVMFAEGETVRCACRPDALARAVRNLIDNAIKYGGGAEVWIRRTDDEVWISVADEGPGIPADQVDQAIRPFVRLSAAREGDKAGFGLGLSVAAAVARGHEGSLDLVANAPHGLIARIRIPLVSSTATP